MDNLSDLKPEKLWYYFDEITKIPRPSKHEEQIIQYIINFSRKHNISYKQDNAGNLLLSIPATNGFENKAAIVLQSHLDMVCEKNSDIVHNFLTDPIVPYIDNNWVKASGTTLGADDGIGVAAMLAILADKTIQHGPIECLFTVDEETGLTGAFELQPGFFSGKTLINLDSEDEGEIFVGCAGGKNTVATWPIMYQTCSHSCKGFIISITGLKGGHSGDDIHRGHANAIKLMNNFLLFLEKNISFGLHRFEGGNLHNAIPREAFASIAITEEEIENLHPHFETYKIRLLDEWKEAEPGIQFHMDIITNPCQCIEPEMRSNILQSIQQLPNGVIAWSKEIKDLVETSTNLASIKFTTENKIEITTSQRSSSDEEKNKIVEEVAKVITSHDGEVKHSNGYPGWAPNVNSPILKKATETYIRLFKESPKVKAIHAGLECGLFLEKYLGLDMISIGPTIKGVHSPDERLDIKSVERFWEHLLSIIE